VKSQQGNCRRKAIPYTDFRLRPLRRWDTDSR